MGKPEPARKSSSTTSSKSSNISLRASASTRMSSRKQVNVAKRKWTKKNKKIKQLFEQLRESHSVINLDDTTDNNRKRKSSSVDLSETVQAKVKKMDYNSSVIVIQDNEPTATPQKKRSALHCSTPLGGRTSTNFSDLNVSAIKNATNNNDLLENFNREVSNLTSDIESGIPVNKQFITVDLTGEVQGSTSKDIINVTDSDCILVSSNTSVSTSRDSQITVIERPKSTVSEERTIRRVAKGLNGLIANLDSSSQGKLLKMITQNIFSGCNVAMGLKNNLDNDRVPRIAETPEDVYIKEMFQGKRPSNSSVGSNIYNPEKHVKRSGPRTIVIDGSNVAMEHGRGREFSVKGLKICIDYFVNRGHEVRAFVPRFRCKFGKSTEPRLLDAMERSGLVVYTPSRELQGKTIASYDDRYIVQYAAAVDGVIVSGDNYRDVALEHPRWRKTIEQRVLPFTWVQDMIMFPRDPLGRNGPTLEQFLRHDS
ncbi:uncharacterized protein LOC125241353 isoform X2 [Leguminivora glycinivorella]|uniref:uncharacterized protein LOC125241353 isoform X2 n=1 Tax=Leguminivora glycinivorella TaxID=1035111 RepID=UPI00200F0E2E|nr:uncharacterized protein LOC125241353 isoform X2 [Leguminivora glycinivorella]